MDPTPPGRSATAQGYQTVPSFPVSSGSPAAVDQLP